MKNIYSIDCENWTVLYLTVFTCGDEGDFVTVNLILKKSHNLGNVGKTASIRVGPYANMLNQLCALSNQPLKLLANA